MFAQLPFEIVDHIVGYLDFEDVRSIACVCSAFRPPAQLRLFRTIDIGPDSSGLYPRHTMSILSSPHLLQYASRLIVESVGSMQQTSHQFWRSHLPVMYRLRTMYLDLEPSDCSKALSALESLGSARGIALIFYRKLAPNMLISDNPLPVHSLVLWVGTSNHQVVTRLIQKCSQSLRKLTLLLEDNITPPSIFLPHLYEFSVKTYLRHTGNEPDLMSWFPFLDQHPTIARLSLCYKFTLTGQLSPDLLPNLQFLSATPVIIERLIPGRVVDDIDAVYRFPPGHRFPVDIILQPLRQPPVPVTSIAIDAKNTALPNDYLVNLVQTLPKLRIFTLKWTCYEVRQSLEGRRYS